MFAPYNSTGHRMAQALLKPHVQQFLDFTTQNMGLDVGIEQVRVSAAQRVRGPDRWPRCRCAARLGVIVLAIRKADGEMLFNPPAERRISAGDHLIVMGEPEGLRKLEQCSPRRRHESTDR